MLFSSIPFLFYFLPAVLILYWIIPWTKGKNAVLLVASLLFYSFGSLTGLALLLGMKMVQILW